jgi:DNA polymerase III alpha subunit
MERAALLGLPAIAIADENSVAGIVRAHTHAREIARQVRLRAEAEADGPIGPPRRPGPAPGPPTAPSTTTRAARSAGRSPSPGSRPSPTVPRPRPHPHRPRLIPAARIVLQDGFTVTALPRDRAAWGRLCRLISTGRLRAGRAPATCTSTT